MENTKSGISSMFRQSVGVLSGLVVIGVPVFGVAAWTLNLQNRISNLEEAKPVLSSTDINRRFARTEITAGEIASRVSTIERLNQQSGLSEGTLDELVGRLTAFDQRLKAVTTNIDGIRNQVTSQVSRNDDSGISAEKFGELERKLTALIKTVDALKQRNPSVVIPKSPILPIATEGLQTKTVGSFEISLAACQRIGSGVDCPLIVKNVDNQNRRVRVTADGDTTRLILPDGSVYKGTKISIGQKQDSYTLKYSFPHGNIPTTATMRFSNIPKIANVARRIEILFDGRVVFFDQIAIR